MGFYNKEDKQGSLSVNRYLLASCGHRALGSSLETDALATAIISHDTVKVGEALQALPPPLTRATPCPLVGPV